MNIPDLRQHSFLSPETYVPLSTRPPLILQAWQRAQRKYGQVFEADRVVVIGDTPLDMAAARKVGVRAIGVATGSSRIEDLMTAQAGTVLPDLTDIEKVIRALYPVTLA